MLSQYEHIVLTAILHDEFQPSNGRTPESFDDIGGVWTAAEAWTGKLLDVKQVEGVLSSLTKKGLITQTEQGTRDACTYVTEAGFETWKNHKQWRSA